MHHETPDCPVRAGAERNPAALLIDSAEQTVTYAEADAMMDGIAARLRTHGVNQGDRVAIHAAPSIAYVLTLFSCWRHGFTACPLHQRRPEAWLQAYVRSIGARIVLADDVAITDWNPLESLLVPGGHARGSSGWKNHAPTGSIRRPELAADAVLLVTSGSTGEPQTAVLRYQNLYFSALGSNENIPLAAGDQWLLSLPLYHVGGIGILLRCVLAGATIRLPGSGKRMDGRYLAPGITHLSLVPTQLHRIFQTGHETALHGVKAILLGGASAPDALVDLAVEKGLPIHLSYGLTEMGSQVTTTPQGADRATLRTAGTVLPYRELRLADDGEILVRGHTLFAGYLRDGHVELPLDEDGWFHTRDLGRLNGEGQLMVIGRRDNQFISGGENVQPEEVERALLRLEGVTEAVVVPVADEEFGHRPLAFVRTKDSPPDADRMRRQLRDWLPGYMIPIEIESWPGGQEEVLKPSRSALATYAQSLRR